MSLDNWRTYCVFVITIVTKVAMVCVAAVALGSSTYAWFVSNNTVTATTSSISAMSNSAFMTIANGTTGAKDADTTAVTTEVTEEALYPARVKKEKTVAFESAYGASATDGTQKGNAFDVGSADEAVTKKYAVKNEFNISAKGNDLTNLKIEKIELGDSGNAQFDTPLRVLIVCGNNWEVWSASGIKLANGTDATAATVLASDIKVGSDTAVTAYIYYDGDEKGQIYTNNLSNLKDASKAITITFTATSKDAANNSTPSND